VQELAVRGEELAVVRVDCFFKKKIEGGGRRREQNRRRKEKESKKRVREIHTTICRLSLLARSSFVRDFLPAANAPPSSSWSSLFFYLKRN
jgi:hypothetical protein